MTSIMVNLMMIMMMKLFFVDDDDYDYDEKSIVIFVDLCRGLQATRICRAGHTMLH